MTIFSIQPFNFSTLKPLKPLIDLLTQYPTPPPNPLPQGAGESAQKSGLDLPLPQGAGELSTFHFPLLQAAKLFIDTKINIFKALFAYMRIKLGCRNIAVPQKFLNNS